MLLLYVTAQVAEISNLAEFSAASQGFIATIEGSETLKARLAQFVPSSRKS
jgi:hypothetical protein